MISVVATVSINPGQRDEFLKIFNANVPAVRAETGCIEYFPATDAVTEIGIQSTNENEVVVLEKWESVAALNDHLAAPHMQTYKEAVKDIVTGLDLRVLQES